MAIKSIRTMARGIVVAGFGAGMVLSTVSVAQAQMSVDEYCQAQTSDTAGYRSCTANPNDNGFAYQTYYNANGGASDVQQSTSSTQNCDDPSLTSGEKQSCWLEQQNGQQTQSTQQVPTTVAAGGQAPANYDATNNRSADTLVLP